MAKKTPATNSTPAARFIDIKSVKVGGQHAFPTLRIVAAKLDDHYDGIYRSGLAALVDKAERQIPDRADDVPWEVGRPAAPDQDDQGKRLLAIIYGRLVDQGIIANDRVTPSKDDPRWEEVISSALGYYNANKLLVDRVLVAMLANGPAVRAGEWMSVVRILADKNVGHDHHNLRLYVSQALEEASGLNGSIEASASTEISIPDLESDTDTDLQAENIKATQAIYFCSMLDEMRMFDVIDKLIEHFQNGLLPLGRSRGGQLLYKYWRNSVQRFTGLERKGLYARCFGMLTGIPGEAANAQFDSLFLRFISAVSEYYRQKQAGDFFVSRKAAVFGVSKEAVRKSARDLASNLSLHGYGITFFAGSELMSQVNDALAILQDADVRSAYGARDQWQVVEQVNALDLGTPKNTYRFRTTAHAGAVIIRWLANRTKRLSGLEDILDDAEIARGRSSGRVLEDPNDYDLVNACEQWLAVNGVPDTKVEEYSQPVESPLISSRPINLPDFSQNVQDALASAGVPMGMSRPPGRPNGRRAPGGPAGAFANY